MNTYFIIKKGSPKPGGETASHMCRSLNRYPTTNSQPDHREDITEPRSVGSERLEGLIDTE